MYYNYIILITLMQSPTVHGLPNLGLMASALYIIIMYRAQFRVVG